MPDSDPWADLPRKVRLESLVDDAIFQVACEAHHEAALRKRLLAFADLLSDRHLRDRDRSGRYVRRAADVQQAKGPVVADEIFQLIALANPLFLPSTDPDRLYDHDDKEKKLRRASVTYLKALHEAYDFRKYRDPDAVAADAAVRRVLARLVPARPHGRPRKDHLASLRKRLVALLAPDKPRSRAVEDLLYPHVDLPR